MFNEYVRIKEETEHLYLHLLDLEKKGGAKAEDVLKLIQQDKASFLICEDGFVIAYISNEGKLFWILTAYGIGNALEKHLPDLEAIAEESGCEEIGFNTYRKGFSRKMKNSGYYPTAYSSNSVEYRKKLNV